MKSYAIAFLRLQGCADQSNRFLRAPTRRAPARRRRPLLRVAAASARRGAARRSMERQEKSRSHAAAARDSALHRKCSLFSTSRPRRHAPAAPRRHTYPPPAGEWRETGCPPAVLTTVLAGGRSPAGASRCVEDTYSWSAGSIVMRMPKRFLHASRCLENLSSGEKRAGCADCVGLPFGSTFCGKTTKACVREGAPAELADEPERCAAEVRRCAPPRGARGDRAARVTHVPARCTRACLRRRGRT